MIKISSRAKEKLINLIKNQDKQGAFLYLKGGGCNGFSYKLKLLDNFNKLNKLDEIIPIDEYKLILCNKSLLFLFGTTIDYKED